MTAIEATTARFATYASTACSERIVHEASPASLRSRCCDRFYGYMIQRLTGSIRYILSAPVVRIIISSMLFILSFSAALLLPNAALAGDDYPPICRDATRVADAGRGNHNQGRAWRYDIHKLKVAEREYTQCFKVAEDDQGRSYALTGLISVANAITDFHIRMYSAGLEFYHSPHPVSARFISYHRNEAMNELNFAQSLLATMRPTSRLYDPYDNTYIKASTTRTHRIRLLLNETSPTKRLADAARMVPLSPKDLGLETRCTTPTVDTAVAKLATTLYPEAQSAADIGGSVVLNGIVNAAGRLTNATITRTSDVVNLDTTALAVAEETTYVPRVEECNAVSALATITVTFDASVKSVKLVIDDAR